MIAKLLTGTIVVMTALSAQADNSKDCDPGPQQQVQSRVQPQSAGPQSQHQPQVRWTNTETDGLDDGYIDVEKFK